MTENQKRRFEDRLPGHPLQWDEESANDEIVALHRQLAAEKLRADQGWARAEAKSLECIGLREVLARAGVRAEPAGRQLAYELMGVIADVENGRGFDSVCLDTIKRVRDSIFAASTTPAQMPAAEVRAQDGGEA